MLQRLASVALLGICFGMARNAAPQTAATHAKAPVRKLPAAKYPAHPRRKSSTSRAAGAKHVARPAKTGSSPARAHRADVAASAVPAGTIPHLSTAASYAAAAAARGTTAYGSTARQIASRQEVIGQISEKLANPSVGIENAAALRPFFDQIHQLDVDPRGAVVRVLQFGDSHTAADMFTGALRTLFQSKWGDGGAGFSYAGYPFAGYRIHGTRRQQSVGWRVEGTHFRDLGDDAMLGMGGVSLSTDEAGSWVSLDADATSLEVQYLTQPGGGPIEIFDGETLLGTVSTDGPSAGGHFDRAVEAGPHHFEVRTTEAAPVSLLGMTTENASGVTYEAIGLNGAEASLLLRWDEALASTYMAQVNPALIVLAYGTNEASDHTWTEESYAAMFRSLIERCRRLAPKAAILVIGPPDRELRAGRRGWAPFAGVDRIVAAQRTICRQMGCAYWDTRSRMGGFGSMQGWVSVQWAQADHTHFTGEGYTELAGALFMDIVQQYNSYEGAANMAEGGRR
jgi:lysophospholipase L1-like esterase